jgi:AcrR family transcriptional regulator
MHGANITEQSFIFQAMPRPKTISDEALLDAALDVVHQNGPAALSFAILAGRVGLASSTIVQRFGTKSQLLQATLLYAWDRLDEATAVAVAEASLDVDGVIDMLTALTARHDPEGFADELLVLREDLRDPVLRERGAAWIATLADAVERRLGAASVGSDGRLGELVVAHWQGTITVWGFTQRAPLPAEVRRSVTALLDRMVS